MTVIQFLSEWLIRSSLLILAGALLLWLLRVKNPSVRLKAFTFLLAGSLAIPALTVALPKAPLVMVRVPAPPSARVTPAPAGASGAIFEGRALVEAASAPPRSAAGPKPFDWMRLAAMLYALTALALLLRLAAGLAMSLGVLSRSQCTGIELAGIDVRESALVASPVAIGVLHPVVLLPLDWRDWGAATLNAVLAHEQSHICRRDPLVQFVSAIHRAVLWANPLSWVLDRCIVRTAEQISDDDAVAAIRDRASYAEILLEFVQRGAGQVHSLVVPMARYDRPEQRIRRILYSSSSPRTITRWGIAAILALGAPLAYLAAAATPQSAPRPAPLRPPITLALAPLPSAPIEVAPPHPAPALAAEAVPSEEPASPAPPEPLPEPAAAFEVASIKPSDPSGGGQCCITILPGARVQIHRLSLSALIWVAFRISPLQISGGDDWVRKEDYDIEAKPSDADVASIKTLRYTWYGIEDERLRQMLQALLIDRFQLKFHRETKTAEVYLLEQSGKPLRLHATDAPWGGADPQGYGNIGYVGATWSIYAYSMPQLARFASDFVLKVPVVDRTDLSGPFDYKEAQPDLVPAYGGDQSVSFRGFLAEMGLKLERDKGPINYLIIDQAVKPSPN